jgi:hypothetical protein
MKNIFRKLKRLFCKTNVIGSVAKSDFGKCTKCKFNYNGDYCNVGTYYAEKGLNKICYEGELWQATDL